MSKNLFGKKIAFLATDGFEQVELTTPWAAISDAGAIVTLVSLKSGQIQGVHHDEKGDKFDVDKTIKFRPLIITGSFSPEASSIPTRLG